MYLCILILPFLSFCSCIFFGRFIGTTGAKILAPAAIFLAFFLSVFSYIETVV